MAISAYFEDGNNFWNYPMPISQAFETLHDLTLNQIAELENVNDLKYSSVHSKNLRQIEDVIIKSLKKIIELSDKLPEYSYTEKDWDNNKDDSIYFYIAELIYEFFCLMAVKKQDDFLRMHYIHLWSDLYSPLYENEKTHKALEEIRKRFEYLALKKVKDNFDTGLYPAITKIIMNISFPYNKAYSGAGAQFFYKFYNIIQKDLKHLLQKTLIIH